MALPIPSKHDKSWTGHALTKLNDHLPVINSDIIHIQPCLIPHTDEKIGLLGQVLMLQSITIAVAVLFLGRLLDSLEYLALYVGDDDLGGEVNDLSRHGKVYDLLSEPVRVDFPAFGRKRFALGGEFLRGELEDVQVRDENLAKGHVDEGGEEDGGV